MPGMKKAASTFETVMFTIGIVTSLSLELRRTGPAKDIMPPTITKLTSKENMTENIVDIGIVGNNIRSSASAFIGHSSFSSILVILL